MTVVIDPAVRMLCNELGCATPLTTVPQIPTVPLRAGPPPCALNGDGSARLNRRRRWGGVWGRCLLPGVDPCGRPVSRRTLPGRVPRLSVRCRLPVSRVGTRERWRRLNQRTGPARWGRLRAMRRRVPVRFCAAVRVTGCERGSGAPPEVAGRRVWSSRPVLPWMSRCRVLSCRGVGLRAPYHRGVESGVSRRPVVRPSRRGSVGRAVRGGWSPERPCALAVCLRVRRTRCSTGWPGCAASGGCGVESLLPSGS